MTRVLIVEDDPQIRRFLRLALESEGCTVQEAGRLDVGLAASRLGPDLVLLDLGLPDGDGLDFVRAFRPRSTAPVVILSARGQEQDKVAALDAGADDYLVNPSAWPSCWPGCAPSCAGGLPPALRKNRCSASAR